MYILNGNYVIHNELAAMTQDENFEKRINESIHSGHFMVSYIDDVEDANEHDHDEISLIEGENVEVISIPVSNESNRDGSASIINPSKPSHLKDDHAGGDGGGFDFQSACKETAKTYKFGYRSSQAISIDASLSRLFKCMTLAYSGKLTSPRWKNFKGMKLRWKEKIRLNNVIWRAWHLQFISHRKPFFCQFATPVENEGHNKPEAVVLEGEYWKRKMETVIAEYKNWRVYHKTRQSLTSSQINSDPSKMNSAWKHSIPSGLGFSVDDDALMDFSDTLFSSLNPRELARSCGLADFIQPGLNHLQPSLEDFMDTFEPFSDLFSFKNIGQDESFNVQSNLMPNQVSSYSEFSVPSDQIGAQSHLDIFSSTGLLPDANLHNFKQPLSARSPFHTGNQLQQLSPANFGPIYEKDFISEHNDHSHQSTFTQMPTTSDPLVLYNLLHSQHQINNQGSFQTGVPVFSEVKSDSSLGQGQFNNSVEESIHPSSNLDSLPSVTPTTTTTQIKTRRSSTPSKYAARSSNSHVRYTKARGCVPIAPNPAQNYMPKIEPNGHYQNNVQASKTPALLPQNAMIAPVFPSSSFNNISSIASVSDSHPSSITIISSASSPHTKPRNHLLTSSSVTHSSAMTPTVIMSPVTLATMAGVTDFQSRVLVGAANKVFASPVGQCLLNVDKLPLPPISSSAPVANYSSKNNSDLSKPSTGTVRIKVKSDEQKAQYREHRRVVHTSAEQKRRFNIKYGFDVLNELVPSLHQSPSSKISKAKMLEKGVDYIKYLKKEKKEKNSETERLKREIESLNQDIDLCQRQLPLSGAPIVKSNTKLSDLFEEYVRQNTLKNWKFWIFSIIIRPLFDKYDQVVNTTSIEEFCSSVLSWLEKYCSLVFLRPAVSNSLRLLSTTTDILSNPSSIEQEATRAVSKGLNDNT